MLLAGLGARRTDAVRKLLKKKIAEGHADHVWLDKAIATHPVRFPAPRQTVNTSLHLRFDTCNSSNADSCTYNL